MSTETIARRYGTALADVVTDGGDAGMVKSELREWLALFSSNADLGVVFGNPAIAHTNKTKVLEELIARSRPSKPTANFLRVLLENGRLGDLGDIVDRFEVVLEERSGLVSAGITTARDLPETERSTFQTSLERLTGKRVRIEFDVNKEIIGGVVTRIGSTVYDGSVKTQLENLKETLING